jgi:hypothetical protein
LDLEANNNEFVIILEMKSSKEGKAVSLQAWAGLEVSRRLRFPHFKKIGT